LLSHEIRVLKRADKKGKLTVFMILWTVFAVFGSPFLLYPIGYALYPHPTDFCSFYVEYLRLTFTSDLGISIAEFWGAGTILIILVEYF